MVKIEMDGKRANIWFDGDPVRVVMEISAAISGIYQGFHNIDSGEAAIFKTCMQGCMIDGSPAWEMGFELTQIVIPQKKSDAPTDQS